MEDPIISIPWMDESMTVLDFSKVKVNGELAVDLLDIIQEEIATTNPLSFSSSIKDLVSAFRATILNSVHQWEAKI